MHRAVAALSTAGHAGFRRREPSGTDSRVPREQSHGQDDGRQTPDENPHLPKDAEAGAKCQTDASPVESREASAFESRRERRMVGPLTGRVAINLNRGVANTEPLGEHRPGCAQQRVVIVFTRACDVGGQRDEAARDCPPEQQDSVLKGPSMFWSFALGSVTARSRSTVTRRAPAPSTHPPDPHLIGGDARWSIERLLDRTEQQQPCERVGTTKRPAVKRAVKNR
jgi:hypothetical protein